MGQSASAVSGNVEKIPNLLDATLMWVEIPVGRKFPQNDKELFENMATEPPVDEKDKAKYKRLARNRTDLTPTVEFDGEKFMKVDTCATEIHVALRKNGDIVRLHKESQRVEELRHHSTVLDVGVPGLVGDPDDSDTLHLRGGGKVFTTRVWSVQLRFLPPIIKRCEGLQEVLKPMLQVLGAGADSVHVEMCHQMIEKEFDKTIVVQAQREEDRTTKQTWAFTSYLWVRRMTFVFKPCPDVLQPFFDMLASGKSSRDHILRQMRTDPTISNDPKLIELFLEGTGGPRAQGPKTDRYLRLRAETAKDRNFEAYVIDPLTSTETRVGRKPGDPGDKVEACLHMAIEMLKHSSSDFKQWALLIGQEPLQLKGVHDCMHEAQRAKVRGDEAGYVRNAMKAVDIIVRNSRNKDVENDSASKVGNKLFGEREIDAVLSAHKSQLERMCDGLLEDGDHGKRERFERQFEKECCNMINFIDNFLRTLQITEPQARKRHDVLCNRTHADLLRYMHVWVPSRRNSMHEAAELYRKALQTAQTLENPRDLVALTTCVNLAVFHSEVERRMDLAADVCRRGTKWGKDKDYLGDQMSPSMIFNWNLIRHNLSAFETQIVFLILQFDKTGMAEHSKVETRPGDPGYVKVVKGKSKGADEKGHAGGGGGGVGAFASCAGMRSRVCGMSASSQADAPKHGGARRGGVQAPNAEPPEIQAVLHWLRGTPLSELYTNPDTAAMQGDLPPSQIANVRWVKHVEVVDIRPEESSSSEGEEEEEEESEHEEEATMNEKDAASTDPRKFMLACAVRLLPDVITDARERDVKEELPWFKEMRDTLVPSESGEAEAKSSRAWDLRPPLPIEDRDMLDSILAYMDSAGIVLKPYFRAGRRLLTPGDLLLLEEGSKFASIEEYIASLRLSTPPLTVTFLPSLTVKTVTFHARGPYVEAHENFLGFRDMAPAALVLAKPDIRYLDIVKEIQAEMATTGAQGGKINPKRVRNLSARRNPTAAGSRGCN